VAVTNAPPEVVLHPAEIIDMNVFTVSAYTAAQAVEQFPVTSTMYEPAARVIGPERTGKQRIAAEGAKVVPADAPT
jgi:hypothetical protein